MTNWPSVPVERPTITIPQATPRKPFDPFPLAAIHQSVGDYFNGLAQRQGEVLAIKQGDRQLTYQEFNHLTNRIAHRIHQQMGGKKGRVILLLEQGIDFIAAIFGTLKAGQCYVPIDPTFPIERNTYIAEESLASLILTHSPNLALAESLKSVLLAGATVLDMDHLSTHLPDTYPSIAVAPEDPAYLIYTSGSTGKPKGVVQNHRNLLHNARNQINGFYLSQGDRLPILHSCSVMGSVRVIFNTLLSGATLYPFDLKKQGFPALKQLLLTEKITVFHTVATVFRSSTDAFNEADQFPDMRLVILGGEAMKRQDVEQYGKFFPEECLFATGLGSTEGGTLRLLVFDKTAPLTLPLVPPGYAVEGVEILLRDDQDQPVPLGEVGEIVVQSPYLALGYWRQESDNGPFCTLEGSGIRQFRTGDLGRLLPDGCLVHEGRKDFQVKIRGFRINLPEVEGALEDHPGVKTVAVVKQTLPSGSDGLVAYVTLHQPVPTDPHRFRSFLAQKLPDYMIPAQYVVLETFPQTPNGKLDRRQLPHCQPLYPTVPVPTPEAGQSLTPTEQMLWEIWQSVLNVETLQITDDFFTLGGNSLDAIRMVTAIAEKLDCSLTLSEFYFHPNIQTLGHYLDQGISDHTPKNSLIPIQLKGSNPPLLAIHTLGMNCRYFRALANHIPDWPMVGLNLQYSSNILWGYRSIHWFVDRYVEDILAYQSQGPYYLLGYSTGGLFTLEVADKLNALGHEIALVFLIDTFSPAASQGFPLLSQSWFYNQVYRPWQDFRKNPQAFLRRSYYGMIQELRYWKFLNRPFVTLPDSLAQYAYLRENRKARNAYQRRSPYNMAVVVVKAENSDDYLHQDWPHWVEGQLTIHTVPGDHNTILLEPHVQTVGDRLKECLQRRCEG